MQSRLADSIGDGHGGKPADEGQRYTVLTLMVAGQFCGIPVMAVRDVLAEPAITPVPLAPRAVSGNMNLRGRIVTAIDLRRRLGRSMDPAGLRSMAVVVEQGGGIYALLADDVGEVLTVESCQFEHALPTLPASLAAFADGVFRLTGRLLLVLSIARLLDIGPSD